MLGDIIHGPSFGIIRVSCPCNWPNTIALHKRPRHIYCFCAVQTRFNTISLSVGLSDSGFNVPEQGACTREECKRLRAYYLCSSCQCETPTPFRSDHRMQSDSGPISGVTGVRISVPANWRGFIPSKHAECKVRHIDRKAKQRWSDEIIFSHVWKNIISSCHVYVVPVCRYRALAPPQRRARLAYDS